LRRKPAWSSKTQTWASKPRQPPEWRQWKFLHRGNGARA